MLTEDETGCVWLRLAWGRKPNGKVALVLSAIINRGVIRVVLGQVSFGIRAGCLQLQMENASIPLESRSFQPTWKTTTRAKRVLTVSYSNLQKATRKRGSKFRLSPKGPDIGLSEEGSAEQEDAAATNYSDAFEHDKYDVAAGGSPDSPYWTFSQNTGEKIIVRQLGPVRLAWVELAGGPASIDYSFQVGPRDVVVTSVSGLFPDSLTANRRGVLRAALLRMIAKSLTGPITSGRLTYE